MFIFGGVKKKATTIHMIIMFCIVCEIFGKYSFLYTKSQQNLLNEFP